MLVTGVMFEKTGRIYYFAPCSEPVEKNDKVVVMTSKGLEMGVAVLINKEVDMSKLNVQPVIRKATEKDLEIAQENRLKEEQAFEICTRKIKDFNLNMKLIRAEYTFERNKLIFYFTSDGRVDFRDLAKTLASVFKIRIELRQIGVRDETKIIGSMGICGRELCCSTFLNQFDTVSIKMAKEQGLSLNPNKISGTCGRLMCCLNFEQNAYEDALKRAPVRGAFVDTPKGRGVVEDVNLLKECVKVKLRDSDQNILELFPFDKIKILKQPKTEN